MSDEIYLSPEAEKDLALAKFADAKEILETVCEAVRIAFAKSDEFAHIHLDELESVMNRVYDVMENELEFHARNSGISHDISIRQIALKCKHDALKRKFTPFTVAPEAKGTMIRCGLPDDGTIKWQTNATKATS